MTKREVVIAAMRHKRVPYVPWQINLTREVYLSLAQYFGSDDVDSELGNHYLMLGDCYGFFEDIGQERFRDLFGVIWNRSEDKDIGVVEGQVLPTPDLRHFKLPDYNDPRLFDGIEERIGRNGDKFRVFNLGFSLFERAWTLRGMEDFLMDFHLNPDFAADLLHMIADWNIEVMKKAVQYDIDCIYYGDDWGQQHGLIMGYPLWKKFIYPELKRMYVVGTDAGKFVSIHSCGDVDELFDDLCGIGLHCFNPFQPEVMDVWNLLRKYHGKLCFYGGLSTQKTLPYGDCAEVKQQTLALLDAGKSGGLIFSPAHAVESDVPLDHILIMLQTLKNQINYAN